MEVMQVLHMNKGDGETSYAKNCTVQKQIISMENTTIENAVVDCMHETLPQSMGIADLGCSSGPNSLMVISNIIDTAQKRGAPLPELRVFLNDLPENDFNSLFKLLPEFYKKVKDENGIGPENCFVSCVAGSFYGRLFPAKSMHFVHSSSSLHWLSRVPPELDVKGEMQLNKGKIYISETSPESVGKAYALQFREDFSVFLRSRAEEMVTGGRMVLSFMGRSSTEVAGSHQWELIAQALMSMALEGYIEEEKIDSFNVPYYAPSAEEVRTVIDEEGSTRISSLEAFEIDLDEGCTDSPEEILSRGKKVAISHRAVVESVVEAYFGSEVMDELFRRYAELVSEYLCNTPSKLINLVISVAKI